MLILISVLLLFAPALMLVILRVARPGFRFAWLTAVGAAFLAWISVLLWRSRFPLSITLPPWMPADLFSAPTAFSANGLSWPYAVSLGTLAVSTLLTASAREGFPNPLGWALSLALCGLGLLAVTANNAFTLVLVWAALDLAEVVTVLRSVNGPGLSERGVIAFSVRASGIMLMLLAQVISSAAGKTIDFHSMPSQAGLLVLAAAGLRLGVLPVHLPYGSLSSLRRGVGTTLRLVSAAANLVVLSRIPPADLGSPFTLLLLLLSAAAALYGGWMWLRAPDELAGRPLWIIGIAGLAVGTALRGSPAGATAWGTALLLAGGALFLSSVQQIWINRLLLIGVWAVSSLPFSLTAVGWQNSAGVLDLILPAFIVAQAFLIAGYVRHALRPSARASLESQPVWAKSIYPAGIGLLLFVQLLLGWWGWDGALQIGAWVAGLVAVFLTLGLLWAIPRFPILNPIPAHWLQPASASRLDRLYQNLGGSYRWLGRVSQTLSDILEGEAGIMWALLFLVLLVTLIAQGNP